METGYRRVKARVQPGDMRSNRVVQMQSLDRDEIPLLGKNAEKVLFAHPVYPIPVIGMPTAYDWACGICGFYQKPPESNSNDEKYIERRGLFQSAMTSIPNNFSVCSSCLKAKCTPWQSQRDAFMQGQPIRFYGLKALGRLPVTGEWPTHDDQQELLHVLDKGMRQHSLRRRTGPYKFMSFSLSHVDIGEDADFLKLDQRHPRIDATNVLHLPVTDVYSMTFVDDNPKFYLLVVVREGNHAVCHVFLIPTAEVAVLIVESFDSVIQHLYTEAVLASLEDNIAAGLEGRLTIEEQMHKKREEEAARVREAKRRDERRQQELLLQQQQQRQQEQQQHQLRQQQIQQQQQQEEEMMRQQARMRSPPRSPDGNVRLRHRPSRRRHVAAAKDGGRVGHAGRHARPSQALMDTHGGSKERLSVFGLFGDEEQPVAAPRYNPAARESFVRVNPLDSDRYGGVMQGNGLADRFDDGDDGDDGDEDDGQLPDGATAQTEAASATGRMATTASSHLQSAAQAFAPPPPIPSIPTPQSPGDRRKEREAAASSGVKQYMQSLQLVFTKTEMTDFVKLLRTYRATKDFQDFTRRLLDLFGAPRYKHLPGLRAFLKPSEREYETFLRQNGVNAR